MSDTDAVAQSTDDGASQDAGPGGSYEVIHQRLMGHARELAGRTSTLNTSRKELFGGTELTVAGSERVRTENNCVPVDVVQVGGRMLFGYNVFLGLRKTIGIADVFTLVNFEVRPDGTLEFHPATDEEVGWLNEERFVREFSGLYQYYAEARLIALRNTGTKLLAVFQTGESLDSIRVFQWALGADGSVEYIDDRGERSFVAPPAHDFEWRETSRDDHILGRHPHVSIEDVVFVETVGGDLTIKVEDNTEDGRGIYREDVDDPNQSLDDAAIQYSRLGALVLLRIRPYMEAITRHLVFNRRTEHVLRVDAIGDSCVQLPEDHGIIFPGGYYLQTGDFKVFPDPDPDLCYQTKVASPNGEDVLFVFNRAHDGLYVLFPYNLIRKEVQSPIRCHGWSLFEDGRLVVFRAATDDEPTRVHPMQVWNTPFVSAEHAAAQPSDGSLLARVGNKDLVRGISDCFSIGRMVTDAEPTRGVYEALVAACQRSLDSYFWLGEAEVGDLRGAITTVRDTAELIIDEFEKVQVLQRRAHDALQEARIQQGTLKDHLHPHSWRLAEDFMGALTSLRHQRGHLITMKEIRYIDRDAVDAMEQEVASEFERISQATVTFLLGENALGPLTVQIDELDARVGEASKLTEIAPLQEDLAGLTSGLDLMTEVVSGLEIDDATARAQILENLGEVFGHLNRARAVLEVRRKDIASVEARADFGAQFKLLGQSVASSVALADTPEACDDQLSKLMLQLEELEARFGEFDDFLPQLTSKREEIVEALGARRQNLLDRRQKRIGNYVRSAERIISGVVRRAKTFKTQDELNAWFASDAMVLKLRDIAGQLAELGDAVKGEELLARLTSTRQESLRGLRDRLELFDDDNLIKFGKHRFPVNTRPLELTMVPRDGGMFLHLTGTDFFSRVEDEDVDAAQPFWEQSLVSEGEEVYRGEYLAARMLFAGEASREGLTLLALEDANRSDEGLLELVRTYAADRYEEGYERGVHDGDAAKLLSALLHLRQSGGLLRFPPRARSLAALFWAWTPDVEAKTRWHRRARSFGRLRDTLGATHGLTAVSEDLAVAIGAWVADVDLGVGDGAEFALAGSYLVEELQADTPTFACSAEADGLHAALVRHLEDHTALRDMTEDLQLLADRPAERFALARTWMGAYAEAYVEAVQGGDAEAIAIESAARLVTESELSWQASHALTGETVTGLLGQHPLVRDQSIDLRLDEFLGRLTAWRDVTVPAFERWRQTRHNVLVRERERLRLGEFEPRVMSAFVRNKLINDVYLPIVGDNLAKQMGAAGDSRRTDQMGLLLLVSPPGYGKTTLMEYIASRLGLVFMKVNGPALGHDVHSLDPAEAPNATARQEVEKINLSFEMANNVMLYLDDIQHTHPEFLQKFISLCDGTRRIEGVWEGKTRTYDLRGKKFCVIMAGNPYTESGDRFQIPDMLANRADTYNLGDILEGRDEAFALSYIENSLTSNAVLQPLAAREQSDVYKLVRMARGEEVPASELSHDYSSVELNEILAVLGKLARVQEVVLRVNQEYIASAAQEDAFRTEPSFKLQGSYRNMNKLSEKIVPAMNEQELDALLRDHYIGEAQTLTTGAEANLLKFNEMMGWIDGEASDRWDAIKKEFRRQKMMGGGDDDPVSRVTGVLGGLDAQLEGIREALAAAATRGDVSEAIAGVSEAISGVGAHVGEVGGQVEKGRHALGHAAKALLESAETAGRDLEVATQSAQIAERTAAAQEAANKIAELQAKALKVTAKATDRIAKAEELENDKDVAATMDVIVGGVVDELRKLRRGVDASAAGLSQLNVLDWLTTRPAEAVTRPEVAEVQKQVLIQAQKALEGSLTAEDRQFERNTMLAGTVPVIQDLFVKIGELLGSVSMSQEEWSRLMGELRHHVAVSVTELAKVDEAE